MHEIKTLGNMQLWLYYEITHKKLNTIKSEIINDIWDLLGNVPEIDFETYAAPEKFHNYCKYYRQNIQNINKEIFLTLMKQEKDIKEEIGERQIKMLKEIGIVTPSIRVLMIIKETRWVNFQMFDDMIRYIKLAREWKVDRRPKNKKIYAPPKLIKTFENLWTTILTVLARNQWPIAN